MGKPDNHSRGAKDCGAGSTEVVIYLVARPIIARAQIKYVLLMASLSWLFSDVSPTSNADHEMLRVARANGCELVSHGCTGKGNDAVRFELAFQALFGGKISCLAP